MELKPYQESVLEKGDRPFALHGTGTGKTLTSLKFIEKSQREMPDKHTVLITSAALRDNLRKEQEKHGVNVDLSKVHIVTHEAMSRDRSAQVVRAAVQDGTLVIDEIHKIRNPTSKAYANTLNASMHASRVLGLTGTGIVNDIDDLSALYNLVQGEKGSNIRGVYTREHTTTPTWTERLRGKQPKVTFQITNSKGLRDRFASLDVYYPPEGDETLPVVTESVKSIHMSPVQVAAYRAAERSMIAEDSKYADIARKIRKGYVLTEKERTAINAFSSQTTQAAISSNVHLVGTDSSNKLDTVVSDLGEYFKGNSDHRGIIYSNKIGAGIDPLLRRIDAAGLSGKVQVITGKTKKDEVPAIMEAYNDGTKPVLVMSDSGAEGLDLKGTRSIQIVNPHFNDGKIKQAVGRGARLGSHTHLPLEDRNIEVTHYQSTLPNGDRTVDQYMTEITKRKNDERDMVISVLS